MYTFFIVISRTSTIVDAAAEIGKNPTSKHKCESEYRDEQTDAGRNCQTRLAGPSSQSRTGTGAFPFYLFS